MANKLVWRPGVFKEIRTLPKMMAALNDHAQKIAAKAGDGFEAKPAHVTGGRGRGRTAVVTATIAASKKEAKDHTLLKAAGGL